MQNSDSDMYKYKKVTCLTPLRLYAIIRYPSWISSTNKKLKEEYQIVFSHNPHDFILTRIVLFIVLIFFLQACRSVTTDNKAEILWDNYGVPHIYASSTREMYYSFGWAQMHNHANLMIKLYAQARGCASEYLGDNYLESDKKILLFNIPDLAKQAYKHQNPEFKRYLKSFVQGINEYANAHPEEIDENISQVLPVTVYDIIAHTLRVINLEFLAAEDIYNASKMIDAGSNALAIAPAKSASGNAMLVINPHLLWSDFFIWFEAHLNAGDFNAYGIALVGTPSLSIAFNEHLGWTHTVNPIDASDRYELTLNKDGYLLDGKTLPFDKKTITIKVKQDNGSILDKKFEFNYSLHGPIVAQNDKKAFAVRIAGLENARIFEQYHRMAEARNFLEFESALKMMQFPMFNIIYADQDGNIFYLFNGNIPVRKEGDFAYWKGTINGDSSKYIWKTIHPYQDLPRYFDPPSGFIQNCNDPPWTCTEPPVLDPADFPSYFSATGTFLRPQRATNMVKDNPSITYDQLINYKLNTGMEAADRFLDDLLDAIERYPDPVACKAGTILKNWDQMTNTDSKGAVLFAEWWDHVRSDMFEIPWDENHPSTTPDGIKDKKLAVQMLSDAADEVQKKYGSLDVAWGDIFRFRMNGLDYPANGGPGDYGIFRTVYFQDDKDNKKTAFAGETFVAVIEFGEKVRASALLSYGNATQPGNKHIGDQLKMLSEKKLRPVSLEKQVVLQSVEYKEILTIEYK